MCCAVPQYSEFGCQTPAWPSLAIENLDLKMISINSYWVGKNIKYVFVSLGDGAYTVVT